MLLVKPKNHFCQAQYKLGYDHTKALTLSHPKIPRCPLFCTWTTKCLAHLFFIYLLSFLLSPYLIILLCFLSWGPLQAALMAAIPSL